MIHIHDECGELCLTWELGCPACMSGSSGEILPKLFLALEMHDAIWTVSWRFLAQETCTCMPPYYDHIGTEPGWDASNWTPLPHSARNSYK